MMVSNFVKQRMVEEYRGYVIYKNKSGSLDAIKPNGKKSYIWLQEFMEGDELNQYKKRIDLLLDGDLNKVVIPEEVIELKRQKSEINKKIRALMGK